MDVMLLVPLVTGNGASTFVRARTQHAAALASSAAQNADRVLMTMELPIDNHCKLFL
jgi:hypothetical protein